MRVKRICDTDVVVARQVIGWEGREGSLGDHGIVVNVDLLEGLDSGQMDSNPSNHMYLLIDSVSLRADGPSAFLSVFVYLPDDFLENLHVASAGKHGISLVRVVLRRWKSLVRIDAAHSTGGTISDDVGAR